jgi:type IV secretory pathway TraG/TraD family ATPase VirD4
MDDEFPLGYKWNTDTGKTSDAESYDLASNMQIIAPAGSGKGVALEMPALLLSNGLHSSGSHGLLSSSILNPDPSGQNAAVCAAALRAKGYDVWCFNPKGSHVDRYPDLVCMGFNPMDALDPSNPARFFMRSVAIAEALVPMSDSANGKFFETSARGFATWLEMYVKLRDGDDAHLGTVRDLATEDEETDDDGVPIKGPRYTAARAVAMGHPRLASMAGRYVKESRSNNDVIATFEASTRWLLDDDVRAALSRKNGIDFSRMTATDEPPKAVFPIVPAGSELIFFAPLLRVIVNCFFDSVYAQAGAGRQVIALLSESAQIGKLDGVLSCYGQGRKYKLRLVQVWQDANQIHEVFGTVGSKTVIANSGCIVAFNPGNDVDSAEMLSKLSGDRLVPGLSASDDPARPGDRGNITPQHERVWTPEKIRSLPPFHALVWKAGRPQPQPVYTPPYWDLADARRAARPDPYHPTMPPRQTGPRLRRILVALAVPALIFALFALLH